MRSENEKYFDPQTNTYCIRKKIEVLLVYCPGVQSKHHRLKMGLGFDPATPRSAF